MNAHEILEFLKTGEVDKIREFVSERIKTLLETEVQREPERYTQCHHIKPINDQVMVYRTFLAEDGAQIIVNESWGNCYGYCFDATEEVVAMAVAEIKNKQPKTIEELCAIVSKVVFDYFGGRTTEGTLKDRLSHIKGSDYLEYGEHDNISAFKGTKHAWCSERTAVMHQIFKFLGIDSQIVVSPILNDGKAEYHSFVMIRGENQTIMLDPTMIDYSQPEEGYTSIVQYLPYEAFETLEGLKERKFTSKEGTPRLCVYNPNKSNVKIINIDFSFYSAYYLK